MLPVRPVLACLGLAVLIPWHCAVGGPGIPVSGQMFVATQGGANYKLGDVEVSAYALDPVREIIEHRRPQARELNDGMPQLLDATSAALKEAEAVLKSAQDAAYARHDYSSDSPEIKAAKAMVEKVDDLDRDARWGEIYSLSAYFYLEKLHDPVAVTRTDADGKYLLTLPTGKFALAARANRKTGDTEETYCWLVTIETRGDPVSLNLANANMTSGTDPASLIHATNSENESYAAAGKAGLLDLLKFKDERAAEKQAAQKVADERLAAKKAAFVHQHLPELVKQSQARALAKHPDLGKAGTETNKKFITDYQRLQTSHDPTLDDPAWPEKLVGDTPPPIEYPYFPPDPTPTPAPQVRTDPRIGPQDDNWRTPHPPYPAAARASHITGTTTVNYSTDASGNVSSVSISQSAGNSILDHFTEVYVKDNWKGPPNSSHSTTFEYRLQ